VTWWKSAESLSGKLALDPARTFVQGATSMRMLFVADLHYALKQFDWLLAHAAEFDPIVIGGDLLDLSSPLDVDVQIAVVEKYLAKLRQKAHLIISSGNHDGDSRSAADESIAQWILDTKGDRISVDGDTLELPGVLITVCPWWDGPESRAELEQLLERDAQRAAASGGKWIWVHHAPPAGSPVCWTGKKFGGDEFLTQWIQRFRPTMVLSGHIHNSPFYPGGAWVDRMGDTWVFNPGRQTGDRPTYIAIDLDTMTAEWISVEGQSVRQLAGTNG
jgi:Icc-related predicted phosphoesterase